MKKLILLVILFPIISLAQKSVPNQSLLTKCSEVSYYSSKEDSYKTSKTDLVISAEVKNDFLFIYNFDQKNATEKSFKITKFLKKQGSETFFIIDFEGSNSTVTYNSSDEGNKKTLLITSTNGDFVLYSE